MKTVILCADDYAQNEDISKGILDLLEKNRLSAVSCFTNWFHWADHGKWLKSYEKDIDIGLHFNLTQGHCLTEVIGLTDNSRLPSINKLLVKSHLKQLKQPFIERELEAQLDEFERVMGRAPDYIDGHQHVHHLPIIRDAILNVYEKRLRKHNVYIRSVLNMRAQEISKWKNKIILSSGAKAFDEMLKENKIPHNTNFAGCYDFKHSDQFPEYMQTFMNEVSTGGLIMCHPGRETDLEIDPIHFSRPKELAYLVSDSFLADLNQMHLQLSRFKI